MKRYFKVTVTQDGEEYVAQCMEFPDTMVRGRSVPEVFERLKAAIAERFRPDDGLDDGSAPVPSPVSPQPSSLGAAKQLPCNESDA
jgi:predicted RNase H-like HicB family nuclease